MQLKGTILTSSPLIGDHVTLSDVTSQFAPTDVRTGLDYQYDIQNGFIIYLRNR